MSVRNRWDTAWKILCDPKYIWGPWFINRLTGGKYTEFGVDFAESESLGVEQDNQYGTLYADKILRLIVDQESKIIHFEFQSTYDQSMGMRTLLYGLNAVKNPAFVSDSMERYTLPDSYIVSVRNTKFSMSTSRMLILDIGDQSVVINYPIVDVETIIPEVSALMKSKGTSDATEKALVLGNLCGAFGSKDSELFAYACALLSEDKAFSAAGVEDYEIEEVIECMRYEAKTSEELITERVTKDVTERVTRDVTERVIGDAIIRLSKKLNISEAQARSLLEDDKGLNPLYLGG